MMFLVTDLTDKSGRTYTLGDAKHVGDIVIGITGNLWEGNIAELIASSMWFGDEFIHPDGFKLSCIQNEDAVSCDSNSDKMNEFIDFYIRRRQDAFHNDSDIIDGLLKVFSKDELELYGYGDFIKEYLNWEE